MHRHTLFALLVMSATLTLGCAESAAPTAPSSRNTGQGPGTGSAGRTLLIEQRNDPNACRDDRTTPDLSVELSETQLWPPNHRLVNITALVTASDNCDANPTVTLVSITSSDPETGPDDIQNADYGTYDVEFSLRSERSGNTGREYRVVYQAIDESGNGVNFGPVLVVVSNKPTF